MAAVRVRAYLSPTLVLLAFDWDEAGSHEDFLGFAIKRSPGYDGKPESWLPNRIGFNGPLPDQADQPSRDAPIQKFMWWDARIDTADRGETFSYTVMPVVGPPGSAPSEAQAGSVEVTLPRFVERGIGTWFNRAVVSSQAFAKKVAALDLGPGQAPSEAQERDLRVWLANGLETAIPDFMGSSPEVEGAIYHLSDRFFVVPAFEKRKAKDASLVWDQGLSQKGKPPDPTVAVITKTLKGHGRFFKRTKSNIMHDKFLVSVHANEGAKLLTGSANFTTEGLTSQANLLHTFDGPGLAQAYLERKRLLEKDPALAATQRTAEWSYTETVGDAAVRVFFSPEPNRYRESIETVVRAVAAARRSVLFCLFMPTDAGLRDACFHAGDNGKMMFGLVNVIAPPKPGADTGRADQLAQVEIYHRFKENKDVVGAQEGFRGPTTPFGFLDEQRLFPGQTGPGSYAPVIIHHKFVVIDGETDNPVIYTGSANMSGNSLHKNDENILEIAGSKRLAAIYLAEFFRLYEHYRARAHASKPGYALAKTSAWARKYFVPGSPESKARESLART